MTVLDLNMQLDKQGTATHHVVNFLFLLFYIIII